MLLISIPLMLLCTWRG